MLHVHRIYGLTRPLINKTSHLIMRRARQVMRSSFFLTPTPISIEPQAPWPTFTFAARVLRRRLEVEESGVAWVKCDRTDLVRQQRQEVGETFASVGKLSLVVNPTDQLGHHSPSLR